MKVFLPWFGHFGDLIRDVLPWIWVRWQPGDVIGGHPLHHPLYPAPPDPRLWEPVARSYPSGYDYRLRPDDLEADLRRIAHELWPRADLLTWGPDGEAYPKPSIPLPEAHPVDVALAPRTKPYADAKNGWPWADLARACHERGWTVGLAGARAESADVPADVAAWDLDPASDAVTGTLRLLRGARAVVTLDSGIGHLASLVDAPHLVVYPRRGDERRALPLRDGVPVQMRFADMHRWNRSLCLPVWGGAPEAFAALDEVLTRLRIVPGVIDDRKSRHVSTVPGWRPGETLVIQEAHRSLVMRPDGNELIGACDSESSRGSPGPRVADPITQVGRRTVCAGCDRWIGDRCSAAGCPCALLGRPGLLASRCPLRKWP